MFKILFTLPVAILFLTVSARADFPGNCDGPNPSFYCEYGEPGPQGIPGPQGPKGDEGPVGEQGYTGPQGIPGNDGATGPQGLKGDKGDTGEQGGTGPQGQGGATGATGDTGDTGPTGPQGPPGRPGSTGADGPVGPTGSAGNHGESGARGDTPLGSLSVAAAAFSIPQGKSGIGFGIANGWNYDTVEGSIVLKKGWKDRPLGLVAAYTANDKGKSAFSAGIGFAF